MSTRPHRIGDALAQDPGDRIITLIVLCLMIIVLFGAVFLLGMKYQASRFHDVCDAGQKFYALGDVDVPYRCTRVIDYPTSQGNP